MSKKHEQHLLIPGLLDNLEIWHRDFNFTPSAPKLLKSLSAMNAVRSPSNSGMLASVYSLLETYGTNFPLRSCSHARACYLFDFPQAEQVVIKSKNQAILCADPIVLEAGMSDIVVGERLIDDLTREESQQLAKELNQHFSQDGWQFVVSDLGHWYVLLPEEQRPNETIPVEQVLGQSLRNLIEGMEDVQWSRQINELQMLLYGSQVNQSRESQRLCPVSSFWMWDVNAAPHKTNLDATFIKGGDYQGQVIANQYGLDYASFDGAVNQRASGVYLYTGLIEPARFNNVKLWQQQLTELEKFVEDLVQNTSAIITIDSCNGYSWCMGKKSFWNVFNKRKKSLLDVL